MLTLLEVAVDGQESTLETPELIKELETFYEVDLAWDVEEMQEKLERYEEKAEAGFSGIIEFEFPEGWEIEFEDDELVVYAPGGNSDGAGCGIAVAHLESIVFEEDLPDEGNDEEYAASAHPVPVLSNKKFCSTRDIFLPYHHKNNILPLRRPHPRLSYGYRKSPDPRIHMRYPRPHSRFYPCISAAFLQGKRPSVP